MKVSVEKINIFKKSVWDYYLLHKRDLPWRRTKDPYRILISEIMLQQTQVSRVLLKYEIFIQRFSNLESLSKASLRTILQIWLGLGYNRRALSLQRTAKIIHERYNGNFPNDPQILESFPGIGAATAGAIAAFAFDTPTVFIETNIRRCFIHFFFQNKKNVNDKEIRICIEQTLDQENPREWYYALMDYGAMLGKMKENPNKKSAHYVRQSVFENSNRQLRGAILKQLLKKHQSEKELSKRISFEKERIQKSLLLLMTEGVVSEKDGIYFIS